MSLWRLCENPVCGCGFCDDEESPERDCQNPECGCGFCDYDDDLDTDDEALQGR